MTLAEGRLFCTDSRSVDRPLRAIGELEQSVGRVFCTSVQIAIRPMGWSVNELAPQ